MLQGKIKVINSGSKNHNNLRMRNLHRTQASHPSWHILIKAGVQVLGRQQMEEKLNQTIYILEARQMYVHPIR